MKKFLWNLSSIKNGMANLKTYLFKELEFLGLKLHGKLKFHKFEFQKGGKLLNIFPNSGIWSFWPKIHPI